MSEKLQWSGLRSNRFSLTVDKSWWPPFFATSLFFPRLLVSMENKGPAVESGVLEARMGPYDGPISNVAAASCDWRNAFGQRFSSWNSDEKRTFKIRLKGTALPREGTYLVRLAIVEELPQPAELADLMDRLQNAVARNQINEAVALADQFQHLSEDPSAPKGDKDSPNLMYREIFDATVHDYFRVDSLPTVLSFWTLVATLLVGIGTIIVGIAAIFD